jgi:hypothetical protein
MEDAERLCVEWNGSKVSENNYLKVNLHPFSYRKRPIHKKSHHSIFHDLYIPKEDEPELPKPVIPIVSVPLQ